MQSRPSVQFGSFAARGWAVLCCACSKLQAQPTQPGFTRCRCGQGTARPARMVGLAAAMMGRRWVTLCRGDCNIIQATDDGPSQGVGRRAQRFVNGNAITAGRSAELNGGRGSGCGRGWGRCQFETASFTAGSLVQHSISGKQTGNGAWPDER